MLQIHRQSFHQFRIQIFSMSSCEKNLKKDFSLSQYFNQLEKYEANFGINKSKFVKKDSNLSSFYKEAPKSIQSTKKQKQYINFEDSKLRLIDKNHLNKSQSTKYDFLKDGTSKKGLIYEQRSLSNFQNDSVSSSKVSNNMWEQDTIQKQNVMFPKEDQQAFTNHCCQLYSLSPSSQIVQNITKQINKRDEVYAIVENELSAQYSPDKYAEGLKKYFKQNNLLRQIIKQFKEISKLEIEDLNELYYFLKSDR